MMKKSKKSSQSWHHVNHVNHGSDLHFRFLTYCLFAFFLFFTSAGSSAEDSGQTPETTKTSVDAPGDSLAILSANTFQADGRTSFVPKDIIPSNVMLHSLLIPGGGQLDNGRRKKALLFLATELVCLGGVIYETRLLGSASLSPFDKEIIRTDRNTFIIVWLGAKLFGMVDAYVDAQLKHFNVGDVTPPGMKNSDINPSNK